MLQFLWIVPQRLICNEEYRCVYFVSENLTRWGFVSDSTTFSVRWIQIRDLVCFLSLISKHWCPYFFILKMKEPFRVASCMHFVLQSNEVCFLFKGLKWLSLLSINHFLLTGIYIYAFCKCSFNFFFNMSMRTFSQEMNAVNQLIRTTPFPLLFAIPPALTVLGFWLHWEQCKVTSDLVVT